MYPALILVEIYRVFLWLSDVDVAKNPNTECEQLQR